MNHTPSRTMRLAGVLLVAGHAVQAQDSLPEAPTEPAAADKVLESIPVVPTLPTDTAVAESAPHSRLIEEVVVTAQKREEALQDVPIAIQAFSSEALDARGVQSVYDLQTVTPGLVITTTTTLTNVYLRGVGSDGFIPSADPSVGMYIDGIYQPLSTSILQSFGQVKRVEVLKGPQGTLFGRNTTGGAINIISEDPSDSFSGTGSVSYESFQTTRVSGAVSGPVLRSLAASAAAFYRSGKSYYKHQADSPVQDFPLDEADRGVRAKLKWVPSEAFDLTLTGFNLHSEGGNADVGVLDKPSPLAVGAGAESETEKPWTVSSDQSMHAIMDMSLAYVNASWHPAWLDVKALASTQKANINTLEDYDGSAAPLVSFGTYQQMPGDRGLYSYTDTAELQFLSNGSGWQGDKFEWIVGAYYLNSDQGFSPIYAQVAGIEQPLRTFLANPLPLPGGAMIPDIELLTAFFDTLRAAGVDPGQRLQVYGALKTVSYAGYTQASYDFADWLGVTLGGRYSIEDRDLYRSELNTLSADGTVTPTPFRFNKSKRQSNFSPKITIDTKAFEDVLVYATWQKGFKSGTYNCVNLVAEPNFVRPEKLTGIELGAKTEFFDRHVRLNAALFQSKIEDIQVQYISLLSGGVTSLENAATARIRGAELDLTWAITPALVFTTASTYLDATYTDYPDASGFDPQTGLSSTGNDFSGNRITRTPKVAVQAGLNHTIEVPGGSLELGINGGYSSDYFFNAQNTTRQPSYTKLDFNLSYLYERAQMRLSFFGRNVTDEKVYATNDLRDFGNVTKLNPPAVYGVRLGWDF